jgi:hypothetical protein
MVGIRGQGTDTNIKLNKGEFVLPGYWIYHPDKDWGGDENMQLGWLLEVWKKWPT